MKSKSIEVFVRMALRHDAVDQRAKEIVIIELITELSVEFREQLVVVFRGFIQTNAIVIDQWKELIVGQET